MPEPGPCRKHKGAAEQQHDKRAVALCDLASATRHPCLRCQRHSEMMTRQAAKTGCKHVRSARLILPGPMLQPAAAVPLCNGWFTR